MVKAGSQPAGLQPTAVLSDLHQQMQLKLLQVTFLRREEMCSRIIGFQSWTKRCCPLCEPPAIYVGWAQRSESSTILTCLPAFIPEWLLSPSFSWDISVSYLFRDIKWFLLGKKFLPLGKTSPASCTWPHRDPTLEPQLMGHAFVPISTGS